MLFILALLLPIVARAADANLAVMEFDLVFPRNETYAPTQYFPLVLAVRNPIAVWPLGMTMQMFIWPDSEEVPPFNSTFDFPQSGNITSGQPPSAPNFFFIAGTPVTNATAGGFTVIWSVALRHTCREADPRKETVVRPYLSGEFNVRFSTAPGAPLPDIEAAVNSCLAPASTLALTPYGFRDDCPLLDANATTPAAASLCGLKPFAKELAANVSTTMLGLMGCSEGTWQNITQRCAVKSEGLRWTPALEVVWMLMVATAYALL